MASKRARPRRTAQLGVERKVRDFGLHGPIHQRDTEHTVLSATWCRHGLEFAMATLHRHLCAPAVNKEGDKHRRKY